MKIKKTDIIYMLIGIIIVISVILFGIYISNKIYEYNCDHIPISQAWKDDRCKNYFNRTAGDFDE